MTRKNEILLIFCKSITTGTLSRHAVVNKLLLNEKFSLLSTGVISNWTNETRIPPCTIYQAFQYFLDITTPPTPVLLQQFAALATDEKQKKKLELLSKVITIGFNAFLPF